MVSSRRSFLKVCGLGLGTGVLAGCSSTDTTVTGDTGPADDEGTDTTVTSNTGPATEYEGPDWETIDASDYDTASDILYDYNLGEFYVLYEVAKDEIEDLDARMAGMAKAEAKLMESGVFIPVYGNGGAYALTRIVPRTITTTSWGIDEYKWYSYLVCNEPITSEDRSALTEIWGGCETQDEWIAAAKDFLDQNGYTLTDTYNYDISYELETWDVIATSYTSDSYFISCTYAGLMSYDTQNVQQPELAESYEVSEDGCTYTFHIREGVKWVDQQGRELADVTANDWVASMKHLADNNDALGYLMSVSDGCGIKNYDAFCNGEITDFSEVGVKAEDDYTLVYTLEAPFPPFLSMLGYGCFAPLLESFYKAQGGTFSADGDEYTSGNYGTSPSNIAYNGPYLVSNYTAQNITAYTANPSYWNADAVNTHNVNLYYNDGTDTTRAYNEFKDGTVSAVALNSSSLVLAQQDVPDGESETYFDLYCYTTVNDATTYCGWVNLNRQTWANYNDPSIGVSPQSEEDHVRTRSALNNQNFRLALAFAFDKAAFNATIVGEDLKYASLKNAYVTGNFQKLENDLTVEINGSEQNFSAGTYYGEIMQAQLDADGVPITVWDPTADDGVGSGDGFDGWYDPDNAVAYFNVAVEELASIGVDVSADNPIYIDVPYGSYSESVTNRHQAYKQSIENVLGGAVIVNLIEFTDSTDFTYAYYRTSQGSESNYDVTPGTSGWGPDYGDPQTFLDTIQPYGYMTKNIGLY